MNDRRDAGVEHADVGRQGLLADPGASGREGGDAQQHQGPHDLALDLGAGAGRVRADEGALQLAAHLGGDVTGGQRPEAGGDAVVRLGVVGQATDDLAGAAHLGERLRGQGDGGAVAGDLHDLVDGEGAETDGDGLEPGGGGCAAHDVHWSATDAVRDRRADGNRLRTETPDPYPE